MSRLAPKGKPPVVENITKETPVCDARCPAAATHEVVISLFVTPLYFCGHHYMEFLPSIFENGYEVHKL